MERGEIDSSALVVDFITLFSEIGRTRQISHEIEDSDDTLKQLDATDTCRLLHPGRGRDTHSP